jgi:hypothetical protein
MLSVLMLTQRNYLLYTSPALKSEPLCVTKLVPSKSVLDRYCKQFRGRCNISLQEGGAALRLPQVLLLAAE